MYNYEIAIPSYGRSESIKDKTLALLTKHNINPKKVTIFVANEEERVKYTKSLKNTPYNNLVVGEVGIGNIRRFIQAYYDDQVRYMSFDDDLQNLLKKVDDKTMVPIENLEEEVIFPGFKAAADNNSYMFGIYAAANPMFMKHRVAVGLYFCVGSCFGIINRKDADTIIRVDEKDDYERSIQHYIKDGCVVRLDNITAKTSYYKEAGGLQLQRTPEWIEACAKQLETLYPDYCTMYIRESNGRAEIRLRDKSASKKVYGASLEALFG